MKHILILLCLALVACASNPVAKSGEWIPLFDGKSLDGWIPKIKGYPPGENPGNIFRIEDGTIRVSYEAFPSFGQRFGHLFYKSPFSRYKLSMEYRFFGDQKEGGPKWAYLNSGVMIHGQTPENMGLNQSFPDSVEVQFLGSDETRQRPTGNICTPGTTIDLNGQTLAAHCTDSSSPPLPADQWVEVEVHVDADRELIVFINGDEVFRATNLRTDDGQALASGTLSLQAEGHDCAFRNIEILPLGK